MRRNDEAAIQAYKNLHLGFNLALDATRELADRGDQGPVYTALRKVALRVCRAVRKRVSVAVDNEIEHGHIIETYEAGN